MAPLAPGHLEGAELSLEGGNQSIPRSKKDQVFAPELNFPQPP